VSHPMQPSYEHDSTVADQGQRRWRLWPKLWRYRLALVCLVLLLVSGSATWFDRERLVGNLIDDYLVQNGVAARYDIVEIAPGKQILANLVVGDPDDPDLTANRVVVSLGFGFSGPAIERIRIEQPRLFGTYKDGELSLGALDPLIFTGSDDPPALPALDVEVIDGRGLIESDFGAIAIKLDGRGRLDDGFAGQLALTAPGIGAEDCRAHKATLFGAVTTKSGEPRFAGPLRLAGVQCVDVELRRADIGSELSLSRDFSSAKGRFAISAADLASDTASGREVSGSADLAWSAKGLAIRHDLRAARLMLPYALVNEAHLKGGWRSETLADRSEWRGTVEANGIALDSDARSQIGSASEALSDTLLGPLLDKFAVNLVRELGDADFAADAIMRVNSSSASLIVPEARLRSAGGAAILAVSQLNWRLGDDESLSGNFLFGGQGLPSINGRMEQDKGKGFALRMTMAEYQAGSSRLAIPQLGLRQNASGGLQFSGIVTASGALPGGRINGLELPVGGSWSSAKGLLLGQQCANIRFDALRLYELDLAAKRIELCPDGAQAMVQYRDSLQVSARTSRLALSGKLGGSPASLSAERAVIAYPGPIEVQGLSARMGDKGNEVRLAAASLTGSLSGTTAGEFSGASAILEAVPFDLGTMQGRWAFADGALQVSDGAFILTDRTYEQARFEPVAGEAAALRLRGSLVTAEAALRHPATQRKLADIAIRHDLSSAAGRADITVGGLVLGNGLDAEDLSWLAKGVVAFADGTITGNGKVEWSGDDITSTGTFATDGLNFAAAFGPVEGLRGEVHFTDLLALTTAPDQRLKIAAINTGVEVIDGAITFSLTEGQIINLADARWPFMGGELILRPVVLDFTTPNEKRYVFEIVGLDAASFVAQMELTNLGATGTFDGTVPIVFDRAGNGRIEGGLLIARPPGGNVAYIGELSYEDLGAMGNYAFRALRSLDYRQMSVGLDGSLTGEIITNFQFDGVRQGAGTSSNFVTRRLANLPIRFRINVKSENFYELSTMVRSFWDIDYLGNPVDRGLLRGEDGRFVPANPPGPRNFSPSVPEALRPDEPVVQPSESDDRS
jgi:translocation and assembly module TamB